MKVAIDSDSKFHHRLPAEVSDDAKQFQSCLVIVILPAKAGAHFAVGMHLKDDIFTNLVDHAPCRFILDRYVEMVAGVASDRYIMLGVNI